jgi:hypothetical protein
MSNINFVTVTDSDTGISREHVIIDRGNGEFTSMLKETYDAQQAEHLNGSDA